PGALDRSSLEYKLDFTSSMVTHSLPTLRELTKLSYDGGREANRIMAGSLYSILTSISLYSIKKEIREINVKIEDEDA
ncbi:hypothetical protein PSZ87_22810, partial [Shigella sonnei]|nr:hypothetical protein [Shigella sonnei]